MPLVAPSDWQFETFTQGFEAWQAHALQEGFAIKKASSCDKRDGQYTRYIIRCTAGTAIKKSRENRQRASTVKQRCPFEAFAKLYKGANAWFFKVTYHHHNHDPTYTTTIHRRRQIGGPVSQPQPPSSVGSRAAPMVINDEESGSGGEADEHSTNDG